MTEGNGEGHRSVMQPSSCSDAVVRMKAACVPVLILARTFFLACHTSQSASGIAAEATATASQVEQPARATVMLPTTAADVAETSTATKPGVPEEHELIGQGAMGLSSLGHCRKIQAAQESLLMSQYHLASRRVTEALRAGLDPATQQLRHLDEAMAEARAQAQPLTQLSILRRNAEAAQSVQGLPPLRALAKVRCWETNRLGLWAVTIARPVLEEPDDWRPSQWVVSGSFEILYVSPAGRVARFRVPHQNDGFDEMYGDPPILADLWGDGEQEILWSRVDAYGRVRTAIFASVGTTVKSVTSKRIPGTIFGVSERDAIHPRIAYRVPFAEPLSCAQDQDDEVEHFPRNDSPSFIAEVVDGKLVLDTPVAREAVRQWCSVPPRENWQTANEVLCARLWGQSTITLVKRLKTSFVRGSCQDPGAAQLPSRERTLAYDDMLFAAQWQPPFRLQPEPGQQVP